MPNAVRATTVSERGDSRATQIKKIGVSVAKMSSTPEPTYLEPSYNDCQERRSSSQQLLLSPEGTTRHGRNPIAVPPQWASDTPTPGIVKPDGEASEKHRPNVEHSFHHTSFGIRRSPRILLLNTTGKPVPKSLLKQVLLIDPNAQMRNSFARGVDMLTASSGDWPDIVIVLSEDCTLATRQIEALWRLRVRRNYIPCPLYFAISTNLPPAQIRYDIRNLGAHFLFLPDVPSRFHAEIEEIQFKLASVIRSMPSWLLVYEGNGSNLRVHVSLKHMGKLIHIYGADRVIAVLAVCIRHNGVARSLSGWRNVLADSPLFEPAGGGFDLPSLASIKMYWCRGFRDCLQIPLDDHHTGFCIDHVIETINPGTHRTKYTIRGEWEAIRI